jgi:hypothetical protein
MTRRQDIDVILRDWEFAPGEVRARIVKAHDGRRVLQMRVELGLLQMELEHRPDRTRPGGFDTYFDYLLSLAFKEGEFELSEEQCGEADREFMQFYHRRLCWLELREFRRAVQDANHTLDFMDFVRAHSSDEEWILAHEQYRPFVLFHRTQAAALAGLEESGPEAAVEEIQRGLEAIRDVFAEYGAEEHFDEDELVARLRELRESIREHFGIGRTLREQLDDAVAAEEYELAAKLRDQIAKRTPGG